MKSNHLAHIASIVINRPLMILPEKLAMISAVIEGRIGIDAAELREMANSASEEGRLPLPEASRFVGTFEPVDPNNPAKGRKPYRTTSDGTAIIPVIGSLVNRGSFFDAMSGVMSYEKFKRDLSAAAADDAVRSIVLDIDSPGGEAVGAFEAGDVVASASAQKEVVAIANGLCCSAAYAIASRATRIVVSQSSIVGSIGVVLLHLDRSNQMHEAGIVPTLIHAGARKVDGTALRQLTDEVKAELRGEIEQFMTLFVSGVAAGRPGMTEESIRATEARTFIGAAAVAAGLADSVGTFESVLAELSNGGAGRSIRRPIAANLGKAKTMNDKTYSQSEFDKAVADATAAGKAEGITAGKAEGEKAANDRLNAALGAEGVKGDAGRMAAALDLSMKASGMAGADVAAFVLGSVPAASAAKTDPVKPGGRAADAPGGLATAPGVEVGADAADKTDTRNDFQKGRDKANAALGKKTVAA